MKLRVALVVATVAIVSMQATPIFAATFNHGGRHFRFDDRTRTVGGGNQSKKNNRSDEDQAPSQAQLTAEDLERQRLAGVRAAELQDRVCNGFAVTPDGQRITRGGQGGQMCDPAAPAPAVAPDPALIAEYLYAEVEGMLPSPHVHSNPPPGVPSIIHVPVFVEVTNWLGPFTDSACDRSLCVTVTASPQLTFDPGEEGSSAVTCEGAGSRYDSRSYQDLEEQADGACAYTYTKRTGVPGRPKEWPGRATVTWNLSWASTSGRGGVLAPITLSADVPKSVVEVQALLTE